MYFLFSSCGNDSVALIQKAIDESLDDVHVIYSDTGWAADGWMDRVEVTKKWSESHGLKFHITKAEGGFLGLAKKKNAFPRGGGGKFQFCTRALKIEPALKKMEELDPDRDATCMIGIRREESQNRRTFPEWTEKSENHGGRELWAPLVRLDEKERNILIQRSPLPVLHHRSKECYPCVNARHSELRTLPEDRIQMIEATEQELGTNSKGNQIVMFSPKRYAGATGIRDVISTCQKGNGELFGACSSGFCG